MAGSVNRERNCDHVATRIQSLPADRADDWQKAEAAAQRRWKAWLAKAIATQHEQVARVGRSLPAMEDRERKAAASHLLARLFGPARIVVVGDGEEAYALLFGRVHHGARIERSVEAPSRVRMDPGADHDSRPPSARASICAVGP